jgi:putative redox protein
MTPDCPGSADDVRADLRTGVRWIGGVRFEAGPAGRSVRIDGDSKDGPSPPETLLCALSTCAAVDVVLMLEKRRTPVATFEMDVTAERADGTPRRVTKAHLHFRISGMGIERSYVLRAIRLSVTKYCTVRDTLDPDMPVTWSLDLT